MALERNAENETYPEWSYKSGCQREYLQGRELNIAEEAYQMGWYDGADRATADAKEHMQEIQAIEKGAR